jgi:hypothetical protein
MEKWNNGQKRCVIAKIMSYDTGCSLRFDKTNFISRKGKLARILQSGLMFFRSAIFYLLSHFIFRVSQETNIPPFQLWAKRAKL